MTLKQPLHAVALSGTDIILQLILFFLLGRPLQKSTRLRLFKSDRDEIWQEHSSSKYSWTEVVVDFWFDVIVSKWRQSAVLSPIEWNVRFVFSSWSVVGYTRTCYRIRHANLTFKYLSICKYMITLLLKKTLLRSWPKPSQAMPIGLWRSETSLGHWGLANLPRPNFWPMPKGLTSLTR